MKYALIASLIVNVGFIYALFDAAVSLDGCRMNGKHISTRSELALKLLNDNWKGLSAEGALKVADEYETQGIIVKREKNKCKLATWFFKLVKIV